MGAKTPKTCGPALATGNEILRRFLNAYRWRFGKPDIHPVAIDARALSLSVQHDDGTLRL